MLDLKFIRENPDRVREMLKQRNTEAEIDKLLQYDEKWRSLLSETEGLRCLRNTVSKKIAELKKAKKDSSRLINEMQKISHKIKLMETELNSLKEKTLQILLTIPNIPHPSTPLGKSKDDNVIFKYWGKLPEFNFEPKPHWEICKTLDIVDFQRASKVAGSNFILFKDMGAKLERALINFMLELHSQKHGYTEISPPLLVNRKSMTGTGQLPNLEKDMYYCQSDDLFLIPTAEVPITNIFANEILDGDLLPIYYTACTPCFRKEAGSYGLDTRGMNRIHQFDKVEMVKFVSPETSYDEHEKLLKDAEEVLQILNLPYRVVKICSADISFASAKCYDIEVYAAGVDRFLELSSCSNFEDFQARRANIRFRPEKGADVQYVHTLNASGVALPRLVIAILENYQQEDGTVNIPEAIVPYMNGLDKIGR